MKSFLFRLALGAAAISLVAYVPYRYAVRPPRLHGIMMSGYTILFPLAAILAIAALVVAARPATVEALGRAPAGLRAALAVFGLAWLVVGMACTPRMAMRAGAEPLVWGIAILQMTAQHVLLGLAAAAAAWRPDAVAALLLGHPPAGVRAVEDEAAIG